jgi:cyclophilin family peptidyl-prolyl cis-trans isomerase
MSVRTLCVSVTMTLSLLSNASAQEAAIVELDTSEGKIVLELNTAKAPKSVANFLKYVESGHYEGTVFHRVIPDFMIQGGGFDKAMVEKATEAPVRNEGDNGLKNVKYTVAMARKPDPHSATSQFFINTANNDFLDRENARDRFGYTVFGKVIEGVDVVDKIGKVATKEAVPARTPDGALLLDAVPRKEVVINSAKRVNRQK